MENIPKPALVIAAAVALFLVFAGARLVIDAASRESVDPQLAYDAVAAALAEAKILPLKTDDELLMAYSGLMRPNQIIEPNSAIDTSSELWLGTIFHGAVRDGRITALYIDPQQWRELRPGPLREAMRKLAEIPREQQGRQVYGSPGGVWRATAQNFHFRCQVGGESYRFTPRFDGSRCTSILVSAEE